MSLIENFNLSKYTSFQTKAIAKFFYILKNENHLNILKELISKNSFSSIYILGEGTNTLFLSDFDGLIIHSNLKGKQILKETNNSVQIKVGSGENWSSFVKFCVNHNFSSIENLADIPGSVGASVIQNIGAYGQEVSESLIEVEALDLSSFQNKIFSKKDCHLSYRNSFFKNSKNKYLILNVTFKLNKVYKPKMDYQDIANYFTNHSKVNIKQEEVFELVKKIRSNKLPDYKKYPNAGSFFINPIISKESFKKLFKKYPEIKFWSLGNNYKVSAAWLIDNCRDQIAISDYAYLWKKQALVIVAKPNIEGNSILEFAKHIQKVIFSKFEINLNIEVNLI
jgi:UDP-N-acetylmuramate dehydrogenase